MTRINLDSIYISDEEKEIRKKLRAVIPPPSGEEDPDVYTIKAPDRSFKIKKAQHDSYGSIVGYMPEEGLRTKYLYPYMPCTVFDIGASFGIWTLPAISCGAYVCAFEPDPRHIQALEDNIRLNGFEEQCMILENAVSEYLCWIDMDELEGVKGTTIDHFVRESGIVPRYIKIDVEGLEERVLRGAQKTIDLFRPYIFLENHLVVKTQEKISAVLGSMYKEERIPLTEYISHSFFEPKN